VDDLQRSPADKDRDPVAARINKAYAEGRIGAADRDIRLGNVRSAQSMAELDLMTRELDQLEAALPAATPQDSDPAKPATPYGKFNPKSRAGLTAKASGRRTAIIMSIVVGIAVIIAAGVAVIGFASGGEDSSSPPGSTTAPGQKQDPNKPFAGPPYKLTAKGITNFLAAYKAKFGTTNVVDLTFYEDYVIVNAPVPGKARQSGWLYRNDLGWRDFGGVRATFPGSVVVDTDQLAIPALMRNVARARRTLNVETPAQAYVIIRFIDRIDEVPSVDIHVANKFQESGYLATTLDGKVERAYPYDR
jgi:hypothetical protein